MSEEINVTNPFSENVTYIINMRLPMVDLTSPPLRKPGLGRHRGWYPQPKNLDNAPDRAKGLKPFDIDGTTIWAWTLKAARKKARLLFFREPK